MNDRKFERLAKSLLSSPSASPANTKPRRREAKMSKETDEFFRKGMMYGFRAGYYSAIREIQDRLNSASSYDKNEKRVNRAAYHMKDVNFVGGMMSYRVSERRIKDCLKGEK